MSSPDWIDRSRIAWLEARAMALWPRLDRRRVRRCRGDVACLVRVISRRTALPAESIRRILFAPPVDERDVGLWFG
jgi:hypothetical protein